MIIIALFFSFLCGCQAPQTVEEGTFQEMVYICFNRSITLLVAIVIFTLICFLIQREIKRMN